MGWVEFAAKKWLHHRRSARQKCNHDRDEMMRGSEREEEQKKGGGGGQADQMSAPEDENELDGLQTLLQKRAACVGLNGVTRTPR